MISDAAMLPGTRRPTCRRHAARHRPMVALASLLAAPVGLVPGAAPAADAARTQVQCREDDPNLKTYLAMSATMFAPRDASVAAQFYAPQFVSHDADAGGGGARTLTPAHFRKVYEAAKRTYGERDYHDDLILCAGPFLVVRVSMTYRMTGPLGAQPSTGRTAHTTAVDIFRFADGKVVERWGNNDGVGLLQQLGLQLPPAP